MRFVVIQKKNNDESVSSIFSYFYEFGGAICLELSVWLQIDRAIFIVSEQRNLIFEYFAELDTFCVGIYETLLDILHYAFYIFCNQYEFYRISDYHF